MPIWAGIDEAGYGPLLGPLVVASSSFWMSQVPKEGQLWSDLNDAVARRPKKADGRLVVNDSKKVYSPSRGLRLLEEGVLSFLHQSAVLPKSVDGYLDLMLPQGISKTDETPWTSPIGELPLPVKSNDSAIASKSAALSKNLNTAKVSYVGSNAVVVLPPEYNMIVRKTNNKSQLLWQKCGMLLQKLWSENSGCKCYVLVDRHGGRQHYRRHLRDTFPNAKLSVKKEDNAGSIYQIRDNKHDMCLAFKSNGDQHALPTALASMNAKYTRELYMRAFNDYWTSRVSDLKPTAGYAQDAKRFLEDIQPAIEQDDIDTSILIRGS